MINKPKHKPKFDAHAEALKFIKEQKEANSKNIIIDSETIKRIGGRVQVRLSNGELSKPYFYNEARGYWMVLPF